MALGIETTTIAVCSSVWAPYEPALMDKTMSPKHPWGGKVQMLTSNVFVFWNEPQGQLLEGLKHYPLTSGQ